MVGSARAGKTRAKEGAGREGGGPGLRQPQEPQDYTKSSESRLQFPGGFLAVAATVAYSFGTDLAPEAGV